MKGDIISRDVRDGEKGCRICENFQAIHSCWISVKDLGDTCPQFVRNDSIRRVVDVEEEEAAE